uniref:cocaine- and amphetamine-regulated transcript protein n=1 Tax=Myxine glutinosa TaxID=7769 RepID=UPI00358E37F8
MDVARVLLVLCALGCSAMSSRGDSQEISSYEDSLDRELRSYDGGLAKSADHLREKELLEALQEVLEKLQNKRVPTWQKKYGQTPMCSFGGRCALRRGPRIGKLCDCPQGTSCSSFLLKCL